MRRRARPFDWVCRFPSSQLFQFTVLLYAELLARAGGEMLVVGRDDGGKTLIKTAATAAVATFCRSKGVIDENYRDSGQVEGNMMRYLARAAFALLITTGTAGAQKASPGSGNALAMRQAGSSALVSSARDSILRTLTDVQDTRARDITRDAIDNAGTCVAHRIGVTEANKTTIFDRLKTEGLVDLGDDNKFAGGLMLGIFPPLIDEASQCPRAPQTFWSAPGSVFGGHHSHPGGLAVHVAFNLSSSLSLADNYRRVYGFSAGATGLPTVVQPDRPSPTPGASDVPISQDLAILAPIWHDWGKILVFQWNGDGSEFAELNFGGNGKTDNYGAPGDSKTGAHHIIGLAETMKRSLPPEFVVTQASAHSAPSGGNEYKVVNWLRTAAILAGVDPVANGYLQRDESGRLRLAPMREMRSVAMQSILPNEPGLLVEYLLHNLSDADFTFTVPAAAEAGVLLKSLAVRFGFDPNDGAAFNTKFRNPVLAHLSSERLQIIYASKGLEAVAAEIEKLRNAGLL